MKYIKMFFVLLFLIVTVPMFIVINIVSMVNWQDIWWMIVGEVTSAADMFKRQWEDSK